MTNPSSRIRFGFASFCLAETPGRQADREIELDRHGAHRTSFPVPGIKANWINQ